ncbi:PD-(D/E)XK nuclease family protein [Sphingomonas sp. 28-62-11]|uniref:PD-(D/E)XK nuclease family protein n=1 Tax=Sphingomonas sp. 28-62-11 TaxID=1970432 RepID=UPI000BCF6DAF|nr:MAG: hypothetical protein B7Y49_02045 [Sphingomonas sp. 28-62-11]
MNAGLDFEVRRLLARAGEAAVAPPFNPVSLLVRNEMDLSRLIAWMLDPRADHGQGPGFLRPFLQLAGMEDAVRLERSRVELEATRRVGGAIIGRIDVEVTHSSFVLLVENKPFADFGEEQLERYVSSLPADGRAGRVVALVGRGWSDAALKGVTRASGATAVRLGVEVRDWVGACAASLPAGRVRELLAAMREDLDIRHGGMWEEAMMDIVDAMTVTPGEVAAAVAIIEARDKFAERVGRDFRARVSSLAGASGLSGLRPLEDEASLFTGSRHGMLRLDIGLADFDMVLEAEGTYLRDVSVSLCARRKTPRIERTHAALVARMVEVFGVGAGEPLVEWYAWWDWVGALHPTGRAPADAPGLWAWAADASEDGLAARFVRRAAEVRDAVHA